MKRAQYQRIMAQARKRSCPVCDALPGKPCIGTRGQHRKTMHDERVRQVYSPSGGYLGARASKVTTRPMTEDEIRRLG